MKIINWIHIFFNGPFLIYFGLMKPTSTIFYVIVLLMGLAIIYAFYEEYMKNNLYAWLTVHLLLFATLFLSISALHFMGKKIPYYLYSFCVAIGIAAIGYHALKIFI